ncbi:MAG TPA: hypothetical protein PLX97_05560 [Gemmatales bacterium]|nr:hypothetical protein [Gemmatales bacterium]
MTRWLTGMLVLLLSTLPVCAQGEAAYCNRLKFSLPFQIDPQEVAQLREAQLYESLDGRSNWRLIARIGPQDTKFALQVPREGEYWYLLRTIENNGQAYPPQLDKLPTNVQITKVIVDTTPPRIDFRDQSGRNGEIVVSWNIYDENLDPASIRLEYLSNSSQWIPINIRQQARGETAVNVPVKGRLELRLSAADSARNLETKSITVVSGGGGGSQDRDFSRNTASSGAVGSRSSDDGWGDPAGPSRRASSAMDEPASSQRETRYVNKDSFNLNFNLEQVGPSGAIVEAFYQADNQWNPAGDVKVTNEGPGKLTVRLPREGSFGMILQVRSGFDNTATKPRPSTGPDMWVCLDKTPPKVSDVQVIPGRGINMGKVKIQWRASDTNLAQQPIKLEFQDLEDADKSWQLITDNLDNSGVYIWTAPTRGYRYKVRVSALDKAKNWGEGISNEVIVDVAQPKVRIVDIDH